MNENDIIQAKNVFEMAKGALDDNKWKYDHNDEKMWISCTANGDDLPIDIFVQVFPKNQLIVLTSRLSIVPVPPTVRNRKPAQTLRMKE